MQLYAYAYVCIYEYVTHTHTHSFHPYDLWGKYIIIILLTHEETEENSEGLRAMPKGTQLVLVSDRAGFAIKQSGLR